ncbi:MAG TPA: hypothetical protein VLT33_09430 [Labilithrix sp.]|nr:hypothetical protein [Labilithrix sp.]
MLHRRRKLERASIAICDTSDPGTLHGRCMVPVVNRRQQSESLSVTVDQLGVARIEEIVWSHPRLARLSDSAKLLYACLVDGLSSTARETIESVELVWKSRHGTQLAYTDHARASRAALREICLAVEELIAAGLLVLLDRTSIKNGWVMKPWEPAS